MIFKQIRSVMSVPFVLRGKLLGAIYLDSKARRGGFTDDSLAFIKSFSNLAAIAIENARLMEALRDENYQLRSEVQRHYHFREIIGNSQKMQNVFEMLTKIIHSDISVLLEGESGTGKELVARALHYNGPRRDKPFIAQFCGNLSETLLESELFGHKRGAFTGAISDKKGLLEVANGGTFFLDEVADIPTSIQTKLLRVLQDGEFRRVGDTENRKVDVRIVSATNKSLAREVEKGTFREDLFYRLNVITVHMPPLRERTGDIPLLVQHFLTKHANKSRRTRQAHHARGDAHSRRLPLAGQRARAGKRHRTRHRARRGPRHRARRTDHSARHQAHGHGQVAEGIRARTGGQDARRDEGQQDAHRRGAGRLAALAALQAGRVENPLP